MDVRNFQELIAWQKAMDLVVLVYQQVKKLPREELYSLSDQIRRAVVSIPSNIAEGQQRRSTKEFLNFLSIAKGSLGELRTQLLICERLYYLSQEDIAPILELCSENTRLINGLINSLSAQD